MTKIKQPKVKSIKLSFAPDERVTSLGGLAVAQRLLLRLGLHRMMDKALPARGGYSLEEITVSALAGFLSGAGGTFVTEAVRQDPALLALTGLAKAPEEVTFWRATQSAGAPAKITSRTCSPTCGSTTRHARNTSEMRAFTPSRSSPGSPALPSTFSQASPRAGG